MNKVLTNMNQDLSALEKQTARGNIGAEDASNRVTSIDESSTDAQYPSAKCVFNALQNVGGGYKDGGQLVDGDFIKVENNTVSSYDNVSRNPVNFYFEVKDGEILNSVVELTTAVNATINVYVVKNGFYYLLGNVGGNTVNSGEIYNINITGNSFDINQVNNINDDPIIFIDGYSYGVSKLDSIGLAFTSENLNSEVGTWKAYNNDNTNRTNGYGVLYQPLTVLQSNGILTPAFSGIMPNGWRIPTKEDWQKLLNYYSTDIEFKKLVSVSWVGTNEYKTNFLPSGHATGLGSLSYAARGSTMYLFSSTVEDGKMIYFQSNGTRGASTIKYLSNWNLSYVSQDYMAIRLCRDI